MQVLYVGRDSEDPDAFCPGSITCMALVEKIEHDITVQDCSILRETQALPEWMDGTPIFVDRANPTPLRGTDAVLMLQSIVKTQEKKTAPQAERRQPAGAAAHRMQPLNTRQPGNKAPVPQQQPTSSFSEDENGADEPLDTMANGSTANAPIRDDKVTDDDLAKFMEARKHSPATATPTATT